MSAEYSAIAPQTIQPGEAALFPISSVPSDNGLIFPNLNTGVFRLASPSLFGFRPCFRCSCRRMPRADYKVAFHGNIQIPEGGTVEEISLAVVIDGQTDRASVMTETPAAAEQTSNVGTDLIVSVPAICNCAAVSVRNISTQPITLVNGIISIDPDRLRS